MRTLTKKDLVIPSRDPKSHKRENGVVLIIGGSEEFVGAPALAGIAALRSGADLAIVAAPEKVAWAVNTIYPDLITKKFPGKHLSMKHYKELKLLMESADVTLLGNGLGRHPSTKRLVRKLSQLAWDKVIDADALSMVQAHELKNSILTPHKREYEEFLRNSKIKKVPALFLKRKNVVVLKGKEDLIVGAKEAVKNTTGNSGLTKGGTGDVLAGLAAGYYAQLHDGWQAALNATYITGQIGDILLKKKKGYTYLASDLVEEIKKF
ncbi:NAD(P)H-hydrate dehydratase [Candidatus Woesearchaeota archaeon]|nr:NAD(P)H-hydrate dehydratase [Candidatus Woesearchaeota archaeon]